MSNFETAVPKQIEYLFDHLLDLRRNFSRALAVQKHDVDVAKRIELPAAIAA